MNTSLWVRVVSERYVSRLTHQGLPYKPCNMSWIFSVEFGPIRVKCLEISNDVVAFFSELGSDPSFRFIFLKRHRLSRHGSCVSPLLVGYYLAPKDPRNAGHSCCLSKHEFVQMLDVSRGSTKESESGHRSMFAI